MAQKPLKRRECFRTTKILSQQRRRNFAVMQKTAFFHDVLVLASGKPMRRRERGSVGVTRRAQDTRRVIGLMKM